MSNLDERLDRIEQKLDALLALMRADGGGARAASPAPTAGGHADVASDADLDSPRGDPEVRFMPKRWTGADYKGKRFSECDPAFLDMLADAFEWFANRDDESGAVDKNGNPKSRWGRLDAARARGWAQRLRGGAPRAGGGAPMAPKKKPMAAAPSAPSKMDYGSSSMGDDEIPF